MKLRFKGRIRNGGAQFQPLESRRLYAVGTTTTVAAVSSQSFGLDLVVKTLVKQTKGAYTPHGEVDLLANNENTGFKGRVDHLGRYTFHFTAGDALPVGSVKLSVRYLGATGKFTGSKSRQSTVTITAPSSFTTDLNRFQTQTLIVGTGTRTVASGDTVTFDDTGYSNTGDIVAESFLHGSASIVVNATPDQTISGVDQALIGMKVGETRVAYVPSTLAYNDGKNYLFVFKLEAIS